MSARLGFILLAHTALDRAAAVALENVGLIVAAARLGSPLMLMKRQGAVLDAMKDGGRPPEQLEIECPPAQLRD